MITKCCEYCEAPEGEPHNSWCSQKRGEAEGRLQPTKVIHQIHIPLPKECEQYAPEIARFVEAMVYKLKVHSKKGKWENVPIAKALELLDGEVAELREAVGERSMVGTLLEAADVANYALIVASKGLEK